MSVAEFKRNFSRAVGMVANGEEIEVLYGRAKKPIMRILSVEQNVEPFALGFLKGKMKFTIADDWKMTPEELLRL